MHHILTTSVHLSGRFVLIPYYLLISAGNYKPVNTLMKMKKVNYLIAFTAIIAFSVVSCNIELNSAHVEDIKICDDLSGNLCNNDHAVIMTTAGDVSVSCKLKNAPNNTMVVFTWKYMEGQPLVIDEVTLNSGTEGTNLDLNSTLSRPYNGWPTGRYAVEIKIGENDKDPVIKNFEIQ